MKRTKELIAADLKRIPWPEPTHASSEKQQLWGTRERWKPASEIIDWSLPSKSVFARERPLAPNTMARIFAGLKKFGGFEFIVPQTSTGQPRSTEQPIPTVTTTSRGVGFCQLNHGAKDLRSHDVAQPMPTITSVDAWGLIEPFFVKYYGSAGTPRPVDEPLDTITGKDRFGLVQAFLSEHGLEAENIALLDIRFRMLQPHELAAAMSFPADYSFAGNREQKVKQIGNAVAVKTAKALCLALLQSRLAEAEQRKISRSAGRTIKPKAKGTIYLSAPTE